MSKRPRARYAVLEHAWSSMVHNLCLVNSICPCKGQQNSAWFAAVQRPVPRCLHLCAALHLLLRQASIKLLTREYLAV